jgi:hypothetical protein
MPGAKRQLLVLSVQDSRLKKAKKQKKKMKKKVCMRSEEGGRADGVGKVGSSKRTCLETCAPHRDPAADPDAGPVVDVAAGSATPSIGQDLASSKLRGAAIWTFVPNLPLRNTWIYTRIDSDPDPYGQLAFFQRIHKDADHCAKSEKKTGKRQTKTKAGRKKTRLGRLNNSYLVLLTGTGQRFLIPVMNTVMWRAAQRPDTAELSDTELVSLDHPRELPSTSTTMWRCRHSYDGLSCCPAFTRYYMYCAKHRDVVLGVRIGTSTVPQAGGGLFATRRFVGPEPEDPKARDVLVCSYVGNYHLKQDFDRYMQEKPGAYTTHYTLTLPGGSVVLDSEHCRSHGAMVNHAPRKHAVNCVFVYVQALAEGKEAVVWVAVKRGAVIEPGDELFIEYDTSNEELRRSFICDEKYHSQTPWAQV